MSASGGLRLDEAYHQVVVRMDEKGTTAAAATAAAAKKSASRKEVRFNADHPFLFAIRHRASGTLLFLGRVMAPGQ
jgi:serpin B